MADDELWHVRVSADEVKTLTLEQIDDLYRLDVIDADTQLWQDGMDEWLPLRVVAGLDEEEVVNISVPPSAPPPKMASTIATWPPPAVARPSAAASSWPPAGWASGASNSRPPISRPPPPAGEPNSRPPISRPAPPPGEANSRPPISRPPPPSSRPAPPSSRSAALASTVPSWPPTAGGSTSVPPPAAIGLLSPSYAPPASVVAQPYNYPRPTNPLPIVFAAVIGIVITLYRNDMLHAAAHRVGQEATFLKLEQALGGPGFGTPRAVAPMAKAAAALPEISPLPAPTSTSKSYASSKSDSDSSSSSTTTKATATPVATSTPRPETRTVAATKPQPQSQPAPRPVAPRPEADAPNAVFKQPKGAKKAKGNEFDPLNPSL